MTEQAFFGLEPHVYTLGNGAFEVSVPAARIEQDHPIGITLSLQKQPTPIDSEEAISGETLEMENILGAAQALRELPEHQRPRRVMELLRSHVAYAYPHVLAELEEKDPQVSDAVRELIGGPALIQPTTLQRMLELGYGICGQLSTGMLILGNAAGLEGAFLGNSPHKDSPNPIQNIIRLDNGQPLFKSDSNYGSNIPVAHAWVEFKMNDNTWLPVDPSTELVGDTEEGMATFQAAHYQAEVERSLKLKLPEGFVAGSTRGLEFLSGEDRHSGVLEVLPLPTPRNEAANIGVRAYTFPAAIPIGVRFSITDVAA